MDMKAIKLMQLMHTKDRVCIVAALNAPQLIATLEGALRDMERMLDSGGMPDDIAEEMRSMIDTARVASSDMMRHMNASEVTPEIAQQIAARAVPQYMKANGLTEADVGAAPGTLIPAADKEEQSKAPVLKLVPKNTEENDDGEGQ